MKLERYTLSSHELEFVLSQSVLENGEAHRVQLLLLLLLFSQVQLEQPLVTELFQFFICMLGL